MKAHSFQFHVGDYMKDPAVRSIGFEGRGFVVDLLCLMHESENFGHLQLGGKPMTPLDISRVTGEPEAKVKRLLKLILSKNVFSKTKSGIIYSRRMVRKIEETKRATAEGRKGWKVNPLNPKNQPAQTSVPASAKSDTPAKRDKITFDGVQWFPSDLLKYLKKIRAEIQKYGIALDQVSDSTERACIKDRLKMMRDLEQAVLDAIRSHPWDPKAKIKIEYDGLMYYPGELLKELEATEAELKEVKSKLSRMSPRADITAHNVCSQQKVDLLKKISDIQGVLRILPVPKPVHTPTLPSGRRKTEPQLKVPPEESGDPQVIEAAIREANDTIASYLDAKDNEFCYTRQGKLTKWSRDRIAHQEKRLTILRAALESLNPVPA